MSKKRFDFLLKNMRFDDKDTREIRKSNDKFTAFRDIWNTFEKNCVKVYTPSEYITVDEMFLSFCRKCPFKICIPMKPGKYGLKVISLCDAKISYFLGGIPYVRKEKKRKIISQYLLNMCYG